MCTLVEIKQASSFLKKLKYSLYYVILNTALFGVEVLVNLAGMALCIGVRFPEDTFMTFSIGSKIMLFSNLKSLQILLILVRTSSNKHLNSINYFLKCSKVLQ